MAVRKSSIESYLSQPEKLQLYYLEKSIDKNLIKDYIPNSRIQIHFKVKISKNVEQLLIIRYQEAGWTIVFHFHELAVGNYIELS